MSKYDAKPLSLNGLRTVSLSARGGKVRVEHFAAPYRKGDGVNGLLNSLPRILAAESLREVVQAVVRARAHGRAILWGLGGHVIKCGLAPVLIELMRQEFVTAFLMNGAAAIHDFEIALAGHTSEDVEAVLPDGSFGSAEETGREFNRAMAHGAIERIGAGEALGRLLELIAPTTWMHQSLLLEAYRAAVPVTVHIAVGTDTVHAHPKVDPASIGEATHRDFRLLCSLLRDLDQGGVYINVGSAVLLPEVFLKAISAVRNLGYPLKNFVTVNLDFIQHYRPRVNVVERPHANSGGKGYSLTGHHEIMVPLLAAALLEAGG